MGILDQHQDKWTPVTETGCYLWLGATRGKKSDPRGSLSKDGRMYTVARLICEELYGPAPTPKHQAAHATPSGCIGGLCVNGAHIRWATPSENRQDIPQEIRQRSQAKAVEVATAERLGPRYAAQIAGEKTYIPDRLCMRGHLTLRRVANGECIACKQEMRREGKWK